MDDLTDRPQFQARKEIVRRGSCFQSHIQLGSHCYFEQSKIGVIGHLLDHVMTKTFVAKNKGYIMNVSKMKLMLVEIKKN